MKTLIKSNNSIRRISYIYILSLLPLIIFGFYKNGISLYVKHYVKFIFIFKPLLYILLGGIIGAIVNIIYEKIIKKSNNKISNIIFSSFHLVYGLLIGCIISINTNVFLFIIVTFITLLITKFIKKNKINPVVLTALIIFLIMSIAGKFTFLNTYEMNNRFNLSPINYLFGSGSGGIATTNVLLVLFSYIILCYSNVYKKNIPIYSFISFGILVIGYAIFKNDISITLKMLFETGILFSFVFVSTDPLTSPITNKGQIIFGSTIGIITFILYLIQPALSCLGAILICSILNYLFDVKFE